MTDLVEFLKARLDEDEQAAQASEAANPGDLSWAESVNILDSADERHIALHSPARVLREVEARRRVLERHRPETNLRIRDGAYVTEGFYCPDHLDGRAWPCADVLDLAAVYADHEEFKDEWRV